MAFDQEIHHVDGLAERQLLLADASFDEAADTFGQLVGVERHTRVLSPDAVFGMLQAPGAPSAKMLSSELSLKFGLTNHEASERVRMAPIISDKLLLRAAYLNGDISWARLSLVTFLIDDTEGELYWVELAKRESLRKLAARVARRNAAEVDPSDTPHSNQYLGLVHDYKRNVTRIKGELPLDKGIEVEKALNTRADTYSRNVDTDLYPTPSWGRAEALGELILVT